VHISSSLIFLQLHAILITKRIKCVEYRPNIICSYRNMCQKLTDSKLYIFFGSRKEKEASRNFMLWYTQGS